jgi:hypothetical protein
MTPGSHRERAVEAVCYADRLKADLINLAGRLGKYRNPPARIEELRETSERALRQLDAILHRLDSLGREADHGKYVLCDQEHASLDAARDLRARMMDTLADIQHAEGLASPR